jgi:hypothetical protein
MDRFKTIEEAQAECKKLDKEYADKTFCPLVGGSCDKSCVCFFHAKPEKFGSSDAPHFFEVKGPFCDNTMFTGERYEQNTGY